MKICGLSPDYFDELIAFNEKVYPERKNFRYRFDAQFLSNPLLEKKEKPYGYISLSDKNEIVGQFLITPCQFHFTGKDYSGFFGNDFFVLEECRGEHGAMLALKAIRGSKPYFAIGVTEKALKIHLSVKTRVIGSMYKFVWFRNILSPLKMAKNIISGSGIASAKGKNEKFPEHINISGNEIKLSAIPEQREDYHWENALEFCRPANFLKWRFGGKPGNYGFYTFQSGYKDCYFVVRKCLWKGLNLLAIVDYRIPDRDEDSWITVMKASKKLAKTLKSDGMVTYSSNSFFDNLLKKEFFLRAGRPCYIMTNAKIDIPGNDVEERNSLFVTMADSDIDLNFD